MIPQLTKDQAEELGYTPARVLPNGLCAGILKMLFTYGLYIGLDKMGSGTRYCYHTREEAELALRAWDGKDDPPGNWIKQKPEDRMNPHYKKPTDDL